MFDILLPVKMMVAFFPLILHYVMPMLWPPDTEPEDEDDWELDVEDIGDPQWWQHIAGFVIICFPPVSWILLGCRVSASFRAYWNVLLLVDVQFMMMIFIFTIYLDQLIERADTVLAIHRRVRQTFLNQLERVGRLRIV